MKKFLKSIVGINTIISIILLVAAIILGCLDNISGCISVVFMILMVWLDKILSLFIKE